MYLKDLGFSLWADFVERDFLNGEFEELIEKGIVNGATSNPAIFKSAFLGSPAYKAQREALKGSGALSTYETLAIDDIALGATKLAPLYAQKDDGFISIEVNPKLCDDAQGTIEEAKRLYNAIGKENVMIKIPATNAGYEAIEAVMSEGISVNATLIFSYEQAEKTLEAMKRGMAKSDKKNSGVISVFVSRFDRKLDKTLAQKGIEEGLVGIFNAVYIHSMIEAQKEGFDIRTLFASTGVKDKSKYDEAYYITNLLLPNSINTAPIDTIHAFVASQKKAIDINISPERIDDHFQMMLNEGIDLPSVSEELLDEGLNAFKEAFDDILSDLE